ncbi:hypothetical protein D1007_51965 [Hordeum vulgare]|nr:hypothetical protein D1007_51965 [Hordeum vulgare]
MLVSSAVGRSFVAVAFLGAGFSHIPTGSLVMFRLEDVRPKSSTAPTGLLVNFTNKFDAYYLRGKVFWCGCKFITFTTYNIFIDFDSTFPTRDGMHGLPYYLGEDDIKEEQ